MTVFRVFSVKDNFEWFWIGSLYKNFPLMLEFFKAPFLVLHFLLYINDLPDDVFCNIAIHADDTTLYFKCDPTSDLWQQLEMAAELESDLRDTVGWSRKWLVDFNAGKTQFVSFDWRNNTGAIDVEIGFCS